ncbi:PH domain-containing protein [Amycolatopsis sp. H20-H5]|uniref:PH domain-containing protein n=1 Tax=Amycolatopsis sp. H20-H5 TaxID=3046309 RepID=UPI002DB6449B|nr:PH domain-containing protein [Amycolatopsis sp. H20-H5]MEC3973798.1 PH domain-containing protein [Amycolatopsis sp. H20-H5]
MAEKKQQEQADEGRKAIFKIPNTALLAIAFLTVCVTPIALGEIQGLEFLYLAPILLAVFVIRTRTVASAKGLAIRTMFGHRDVPWSALKGVVITKKSKVRAVLTDESQLALPTVRTRHLPVLSLVSEGRLPDPSGVLYQEREPAEDTGQSEASPQE